MKKVSKSFRLSKKAIEELEVLLKIEERQADALGISASSMTEIVERSIDTLYTMITDEVAGDNYLSRMTSLIKDAVNQSSSGNNLAINSILYDLAFIKEILLVILKAGAFPKDSKLIHDIVYSKSLYQPVVEEKINEQIK